MLPAEQGIPPKNDAGITNWFSCHKTSHLGWFLMTISLSMGTFMSPAWPGLY